MSDKAIETAYGARRLRARAGGHGQDALAAMDRLAWDLPDRAEGTPRQRRHVREIQESILNLIDDINGKEDAS